MGVSRTKYPTFFNMNSSKGITNAIGGHVTEFGGYRIHTFLNDYMLDSNSINFTRTGDIEVLIVAGGGSGGMHNTTNANGGGGAGGLYTGTMNITALGIYNITVGDKGYGITRLGTSQGSDGSPSIFNSITVPGGGGGGANGTTLSGRSGGSGGGGAYSGAGGAATSSGTGFYGNAGGGSNQTWTGGGGGGAGSAGVAGNGGVAPAGNGGQGLSSTITGTVKYYAGGGGGGGNSSERAGDGYHGGGRGFGTTTQYGYTSYPREVNATTLGYGTLNAVPNTGAGGGGGSYWGTNGNWPSGSGDGASGIVIIRYPYTTT